MRLSLSRSWVLPGTGVQRAARIAVKDGAIAGYGVLRRCLSGYKIGPLFAEDEATAEALFAALCATAPGEEIAPDTPVDNEAAVALATRHGLAPVFETARMYRGAAPALPVTDALWTGSAGLVTGTRDRTGLYRAQTPQGFALEAIRAAHAAHKGGAADDVEVARAHGMEVAIVPGDEDNIKITMPGDFDRAERLLWGRDGH